MYLCCYMGEPFLTIQVQRHWTNHYEILPFDSINTLSAITFSLWDLELFDGPSLKLLPCFLCHSSCWDCGLTNSIPCRSYSSTWSLYLALLAAASLSAFLSTHSNIHWISQILFRGTALPTVYRRTNSLRSMVYIWLRCSLRKLLLMFFIDYCSPSLHAIRELCNTISCFLPDHYQN